MEPLSPPLFVTALAAGMISFASPCVLPLVPAYLGFITGRSVEELQDARGKARITIVTQGLAFVLGLAVIFALLGASASVLGQTLLQNRSRKRWALAYSCCCCTRSDSACRSC